MNKNIALPALGLTIGVLALLVGCGSVSVGGGVDAQKVQNAITAKINDQVPAGTAVEVTCPSGIAPAVGGTFDCTATIAGQPLAFRVTQTDANGNITFVQDSAIIQTTVAQTALAPQLDEQLGGTWTLDCAAAGTAVIIRKPAGTFTCSATGVASADQQTGIVTLTVTDVEGNTTFAYKEN